jgi:hypothetical protein
MSSEQPNGEYQDLSVSRRLGVAPRDRADCSDASNCPDVFELANGDFAVNGQDVSFELELPADAGRSETERTVVIPRDVLLAAFRDLSGSI